MDISPQIVIEKKPIPFVELYLLTPNYREAIMLIMGIKTDGKLVYHHDRIVLDRYSNKPIFFKDAVIVPGNPNKQGTRDAFIIKMCEESFEAYKKEFGFSDDINASIAEYVNKRLK